MHEAESGTGTPVLCPGLRHLGQRRDRVDSPDASGRCAPWSPQPPEARGSPAFLSSGDIGRPLPPQVLAQAAPFSLPWPSVRVFSISPRPSLPPPHLRGVGCPSGRSQSIILSSVPSWAAPAWTITSPTAKAQDVSRAWSSQDGAPDRDRNFRRSLWGPWGSPLGG